MIPKIYILVKGEIRTTIDYNGILPPVNSIILTNFAKFLVKEVIFDYRGANPRILLNCEIIEDE